MHELIFEDVHLFEGRYVLRSFSFTYYFQFLYILQPKVLYVFNLMRAFWQSDFSAQKRVLIEKECWKAFYLISSRNEYQENIYELQKNGHKLFFILISPRVTFFCNCSGISENIELHKSYFFHLRCLSYNFYDIVTTIKEFYIRWKL